MYLSGDGGHRGEIMDKKELIDKLKVMRSAMEVYFLKDEIIKHLEGKSKKISSED